MADAHDIINKLSRVVSSYSRIADQVLLEQFGIGYAQYKVLSSLKLSSKQQQRQIAVELGQTEASISRQIRLLTLSGHIMSVKNPSNLRENRVRLTPKGIRVVDAADMALSKYAEIVLEKLSKKQNNQISDILDLLKV